MDKIVRSQYLGVITCLVTGGLLLLVIICGTILFYKPAFSEAPSIQQPDTFLVDRGQSLHAVAKKLSQLNLLDHPKIFLFYAKITQQAHRVQAGEYTVIKGEVPADLLQRMVKGDVTQYSITFVEGQVFSTHLRDILGHAKIAQKKALNEMDDDELLNAIESEWPFLEGTLYPDTYQFAYSSDGVEILKRAHQKMDTILNTYWEKRPKNFILKNRFELLILASIVEKETAHEDDRNLIAQVFLNRLKKNMRLQSDPTVIYALGDTFDGNLKKKDLRKKLPHNTYVNKGLPPTPIATPSEAALDAIINATAGNYLYFVAMGNGKSYFSKTLKEHNAAVWKYQKRKQKKTKS